MTCAWLSLTLRSDICPWRCGCRCQVEPRQNHGQEIEEVVIPRQDNGNLQRDLLNGTDPPQRGMRREQEECPGAFNQQCYCYSKAVDNRLH